MSESDFKYPIIWIFTRWENETTPPGTILRNDIFLVGHCGFFMFNFINVCCILIFHGFVLRRLSQNFLVQMALLACCGQVASCLCSIHRYNTNDEFGYFAHASTLTGLVAYTFFNFVILNVFLNCNRKIGYIWLGMAIWIALAIGCWVIGRARWETHDFKYFRYFITLSTVFQIISYISVLWAFSKKKIKLPESFPISSAVVTRVFKAAIGLEVLALVCANSGWPIFQYPATGMTFSVMVIVASFVGEMDFMGEAPAAVAGGTPANEQTSLMA